MLTINQVKQYLINFFKNHLQINTVVYDSDFNFNAEDAILYKVAQIQPVDPVQTTYNEVIYKFKIVVADIIDPENDDSQNDIQSDCISIANDFISYFGDEDFQDFYLDKNVSIQTFTEKNGDRIAGCVFAFGIRQTRLFNPCTIPLVNPFSGVSFTGYIPNGNYYYNLLADYLTYSSASTLFQPKGNYVSGTTVDLTDFYTKEQANALFLTGYTPDLSNYYTKTETDSKYQLIGSYVSASTLANYQLAGDYVSASTLANYQPLGNYVSASTLSSYQLAGDYVSASTLSNYLTASQISAAYQPLGNYVSASTLANYQLVGNYVSASTLSNYQTSLTITTSGNSGSASFNSPYLNIPTYTLAGLGGIALNSLNAISPLTYNSGTGVFNIQSANTSQSGYLLSADWNSFNNKQPQLNGTGYTKFLGTSASYISSIPNSDLTNSSITIQGNNVALGGSINVLNGTGFTKVIGTTISYDNTSYQPLLSITTSGNSGSATFNSPYINIPTYTLAGLGGIGLTALSASSPLSYNNSTGAFSIQSANTSQSGYLVSTDWNTFNNKQPQLSGTGYTKFVGSSVSYISTIPNSDLTNSSVTIQGSSVSLGGSLNIISGTGFVKASGLTLTYDNTAYQPALALTTTGSTGAATFDGVNLNIPQYAGTTYTASNGLSLTGSTFGLGGTLIQNTNTEMSGHTFKFTDTVGTDKFSVGNGSFSIKEGVTATTNSFLTVGSGSFSSGTYIANSSDNYSFFSNTSNMSLTYAQNSSGTSKQFSISPTAIQIYDSVSLKGMTYSADYSPNGKLDNRWIPDYGAVKSYVSSATSGFTNIILSTSGSSGSSTLNNGYLNIPTYTLAGLGGQTAITLTTSGSSGAATLNSGFLNIPQYAGGGTSANPSALIGLTAVSGSASTFMTSDSAPALSQAIVPTWTGVHTFSTTNTASATATTNVGTLIKHTINQSSGANFTDLVVNRISTSAGTGTQRLLDLQVNGSSTFNVNSSGYLSATNGATLGATQVQVFNQNNTLVDGAFMWNTASSTSSKPVVPSLNLRWQGSVWNTTATAAANYFSYINYATGVSGNTPTSTLVWAGSLTNSFSSPSYSNIMTLSSTGTLTLFAPVVTKGYTVGTLPTGVQGMMCYVTDSNSTSVGIIVSGSGSNVKPVFYNGTNWVTM